MGSKVPGMTELGTDWRVIDGVATAWFDAPSLIEGAALAGRIVELSAEIAVDLRATGLRVRLGSDEHAEAVSAGSARSRAGPEPSRAAAPERRVRVREAVEGVRLFWQRVLDYAPGEDGELADPLRRDPAIRIRQSTEPLPLRNRIHIDGRVRPAAAVERANLGEASGPFGVRHTDPDGNEVDLVPGGALDEGSETVDWQAVFGAMTCYRIASPAQQRDLADAAAALADNIGFPLLVDLRPGLVIIDSGKDQWEDDAHGLRSSTSPTSPETCRPLRVSSAPLRILGCRASLSSSSTPPRSPRSARSGSLHSDTPTTGDPESATSTIRGD